MNQKDKKKSLLECITNASYRDKLLEFSYKTCAQQRQIDHLQS